MFRVILLLQKKSYKFEFDIQRTVHRVYSYNKTNEMHNFSNLFWNTTLPVSDSTSFYHQESSTVHTAIGICRTAIAVCTVLAS